MTPLLQKKIFNRLLFGLKLDAYLFLGSSESPMPIITNLDIVDKKWKVYRNLKKKRTISFDAFSMPEMIDNRLPALTPSPDAAYIKTNANLSDEMYVSLADELGCLVILIDEKTML